MYKLGVKRKYRTPDDIIKVNTEKNKIENLYNFPNGMLKYGHRQGRTKFYVKFQGNIAQAIPNNPLRKWLGGANIEFMIFKSAFDLGKQTGEECLIFPAQSL